MTNRLAIALALLGVPLPVHAAVVDLTQTTSSTITPSNSAACDNVTYHTDNSYYRAFDMATELGRGMTITSVDVGIQQASSPGGVGQPMSVRLYPIDRGRKMRVYTREQVGHLWIIDPIARTLEVYRLDGERWIVASTHGGNDPINAEPFDAITLAPSRWWLEPEGVQPIG